MAFIKMAPQFGAAPSGNHLESISKSQNYGESGFINQIPTSMDMGLKDGVETMYQWFFGEGQRSPSRPLPVKFGEEMDGCDSLSRITWYGHSAVLLEIDQKLILIDPMLGNAASPVPFMTKRFAYEKPIDLESIPAIDVVVLSHDHYDHLDYQSITRLKDKVGHFYTPLGVGAHLERWGVNVSKITELDWWDSASIEQISIVAAPARHFSGRGLTDRNKTQWASWIIIGSSEKIYFSGDSGYGPHFKKIGERYGPFDFAMMECGQYNEKWASIHMMPEETVQASIDVGAKKMMPIHWSAFNLSLHSWTDPVERASAAAKLHNINMVTPLIGQTFCPGGMNGSTSWWKSL